ncbi:helix-turn-helix domain-containing protein [Kitasatospora sp. NPDC057936]|uniref:helix-turn-helix domain-containing protein n=1 Tax=Kitasatospora sp. NPDC057936 TaxID=3346283 RepID=UPI0036D7EDDD
MGSAWKQLPEELTGPARSLAEELRTLKDAAGLSLSELATRTHYSRASWERWLNGKRVITEQALDALIGAVECDGPALRALWQQAVAGPSGAETGAQDTAAEADADADAPRVAGVQDTAEPVEVLPAGEPEPATAWWRRPAPLLACAAVVALVLVLVGLRATRHDDPSTPLADPGTSSAPVTVPAKPVSSDPTCQAMGCAHKNPKDTGCGKDARTLQSDVIGKVVIYLRYSQKCQAVWAAINEGQPQDYATITSSTGESEQALIHYGYDNYSLMLSAADPAVTFQVCGHQPEGNLCIAPMSDPAGMVASTPIPVGPASPPPGVGGTASPTADATASPSAAPTAVS